MKIAIMGTGGVGGYFGGRLAAGGQEVAFIARGEHLDAIRANGLQIVSAVGDVLVQPAVATDDPSVVGQVDVVMIGVKLWATDEAVAAIKPLVGPATAVVSFQNGVIAVDSVRRAYGDEHTLGGVANIAAVIERPGVIRHNGKMAVLSFGELDGESSPRVEAFHAACAASGIEARIVPGIYKAIWEKYIFLASMSAITALTRLPIGPLRDDADSRVLIKQLLTEVTAVGTAQGVRLDVDTVDKLLTRMDGLPRDMIASMLGDLERGNRLELPWLSGGVVELGRALHIPTPAHAMVFAALKHYVNGVPPDARIAQS
jgi:2-dehydropantoate 2-reductase